MSKIISMIEHKIIKIEAFLKVKNLHTAIITFLLITVAALLGYIIYIQNVRSFDINEMVAKLLSLLIQAIILAVIMGILSNYLYDRMKNYMQNHKIQVIEKSLLLDMYLPRDTDDRHYRTLKTIDRIKKMKGEVCLLGIAATSYLPFRKDNDFSSAFKDGLMKNKISLRIILLNPYSLPAKYRYAREKGEDIDSVTEKRNYDYDNSGFFSDINNTIKTIMELRKNGAKIDCKLTNFEPSISTMLSNDPDFFYVDILTLGRSSKDESLRTSKQESTLPILEFSTKSEFYDYVKSHFEYHWKYGITLDEYENNLSIFKERFNSFSNTGYRLVKLHDSWLSIDPKVGCNNGCKYCVLRTSFSNNCNPKEYFKCSDIHLRIRESKYYNEESILSLFNFTDALLEANREDLLQSLKSLKDNGFRNTVVIATKVPFTESILDGLCNAYFKEKLLFFVSFSGLPNLIEPSFNKEGIIETMDLLINKKMPFVHYWRPITKLNSSMEAIHSVLNVVKSKASSSVVVGLKASKSLNHYYEELGLIDSNLRDINHGEHFPDVFGVNLKEYMANNNVVHPIYRHSSCAVSNILNIPDYNGTMFRRNVCSLNENTGYIKCPDATKQKCNEHKNMYKNQEEDKKIVKTVIMNENFQIEKDRIIINSPILQDDIIFLTQKLKKPVFAQNIIYTNQYVGSVLM